MTEPAPRKSDLGVRVVSAVVMVAVAGTALWLGGLVFSIFVAAVALGVYWEWWGLVGCLTAGRAARAAWMIGGAVYIGTAAIELIGLRSQGIAVGLFVLVLVVAVDIGAYFAGRSIGGPKIAPKISPSKTWAGLGGGIAGGSLAHFAMMPWIYAYYSSASVPTLVGLSMLAGVMVAVVAQSGDFFESWMKRRADVKDSGSLIPGHGGLFDRTDGLIAVLFVAGCASVVPSLMSNDMACESVSGPEPVAHGCG